MRYDIVTGSVSTLMSGKQGVRVAAARSSQRESAALLQFALAARDSIAHDAVAQAKRLVTETPSTIVIAAKVSCVHCPPAIKFIRELMLSTHKRGQYADVTVATADVPALLRQLQGTHVGAVLRETRAFPTVFHTHGTSVVKVWEGMPECNADFIQRVKSASGLLVVYCYE